MTSSIKIKNVRFRVAQSVDAARGIRGWVSFNLDDWLRVEGVCVRRTRDGKATLSFPVSHDHYGNRYFLIRPLHDSARRMIEQEIFTALESLEAKP